MQSRTVFVALVCGFLSMTGVVLADGGFFVLTEEIGQAADLAQTRQDVLMAMYSALPTPDECVDAWPIQFPSGQFTADLSAATGSGTPGCGEADDHDLWYRFTPEGDGHATFFVQSWSGEAFPDVTLSVYRDCPQEDSQPLACDDSQSAPRNDSRLIFLPVSLGETYVIRVSGRSETRYFVGASYDTGGSPPADTCAEAPEVAPNLPYVRTSFVATNDAEVDCGDTADSPDLWYRFTAREDGDVVITLSTGRYADQEPIGFGLSVHSECPGSDDNMLACVDDYGAASVRMAEREEAAPLEIALSAAAGETYYVRIANPAPRESEYLQFAVAAGDSTEDHESGALPHVTYVLGSRYQGDPSEFAWVIPVPTTPTGVIAHEDGSIFTDLDEATKPIFLRSFGVGRPGGGCGCAAGGGMGVLQDNGVAVEASGQAGVFEWAALTSTGSDALLTWLEANGYSVPAEAEDVLDSYIQQGRHFLALRIAEPEQILETGDGRIEIPPIQFTCQTSERYYPMAISQVSAAETTEIRIYVIAEHRAAAANVANVLIDPRAVSQSPGTESGTNYEALVTQATAQHGGRALVTEYAGPQESWWMSSVADGVYPPDALPEPFLTRMRAIVARQDMNVDFELQDAQSDEPVSREFMVTSGSAETSAAAVGEPLAALVAFTAFRSLVRRHRKQTRRSRSNRDRRARYG